MAALGRGGEVRPTPKAAGMGEGCGSPVIQGPFGDDRGIETALVTRNSGEHRRIEIGRADECQADNSGFSEWLSRHLPTRQESANAQPKAASLQYRGSDDPPHE